MHALKGWVNYIFLPQTGRTDSTRNILVCLLGRTSILSLLEAALCRMIVKTKLNGTQQTPRSTRGCARPRQGQRRAQCIQYHTFRQHNWMMFLTGVEGMVPSTSVIDSLRDNEKNVLKDMCTGQDQGCVQPERGSEGNGYQTSKNREPAE